MMAQQGTACSEPTIVWLCRYLKQIRRTSSSHDSQLAVVERSTLECPWVVVVIRENLQQVQQVQQQAIVWVTVLLWHVVAHSPSCTSWRWYASNYPPSWQTRLYPSINSSSRERENLLQCQKFYLMLRMLMMMMVLLMTLTMTFRELLTIFLHPQYGKGGDWWKTGGKLSSMTQQHYTQKIMSKSLCFSISILSPLTLVSTLLQC